MMTKSSGRISLPAPCLSLQYIQYTHATPPSAEGYPLVIFLHGAGERGEDLGLVALHGWPRYAGEGTDYPFILVAPQLPAGKHWCERRLPLWKRC